MEEKTMNIEIANRLVGLRKKSGLSQEELASKLGLSRQAVSKWERAEASPDTDNLICLAKLYGVSLDDLLDTEQAVEDIARNTKEQQTEASKTAPAEPSGNQSKAETSQQEAPKSEQAGSGDKAETGKTQTTIDNDGIHTIDKDGKRIDIDKDGIHVTKDGSTTTVLNKNGVYHWKNKQSPFKIVADVLTGVISLLCVAAYLLVGFLLTDRNVGWAAGWPIFFLIPIVGSLFEAIRKKRFCDFCFPCLVAGVYLFLGMYGNYIGVNFWHPWWILFLTIPVYYAIFAPIDNVIHKGQECTFNFTGGSDDKDDDNDSLDDLKDDIDDAQDDVDDAQDDLEDAQGELKDAESELQTAKTENELGPADHNREVADAKDERDDAQDEVDEAKQELDHAQHRLERAKARYAQRLKEREPKPDNVSTADAVNVEATDKKDEKKD